MHRGSNLEATKLKIRLIRRLSNQNDRRQEPLGDDFSESNIFSLSLRLRQLYCGALLYNNCNISTVCPLGIFLCIILQIILGESMFALKKIKAKRELYLVIISV